jgi:alpha-glucosidase (family GH31 glycosyl hydrolase)
MGGVVDPELYLRWLQYGVFSPIFRLHSTKNPYLERLPWGFGKDIEIKSASAMRLRHALIPYLYTAA